MSQVLFPDEGSLDGPADDGVLLIVCKGIEPQHRSELCGHVRSMAGRVACMRRRILANEDKSDIPDVLEDQRGDRFVACVTEG